jgi:hypothetical protein
MVLFTEVDKKLSAPENLLNPVVVPMLIKKAIDIFDSFVDSCDDRVFELWHHNFLSALLQELHYLLFNVRDEFDFHLILEVEDALFCLSPRLWLQHCYIMTVGTNSTNKTYQCSRESIKWERVARRCFIETRVGSSDTLLSFLDFS